VPAPNPAAVPSKDGPGEAVLAYGKACDELKFEGAVKLLAKAELERIRKPMLVNVNILKGVEEGQRKEAVVQMGIEDKDLSLPEDQLFVKVMNAKMKKEKADAEQKGEKWGFNMTFVSEKIDGDKAVVTVKVAGGGDMEVQVIKEDGAWKLAMIPEKGSAPAPKKDGKSGPSLSPSEVLRQFAKCFKSADAAGAVDLISAECLRKQASEIRQGGAANGMLGLSEDDLEKDDKALMTAYFAKVFELLKTMSGLNGEQFEFKIEVIDEKITGDNAVVNARIFQMDSEEPKTEEIPLVRENGKWKINKFE
jgi:hypothetical protein